MILSRASWTNRNAPSREAFCTCAVLSILVAAPIGGVLPSIGGAGRQDPEGGQTR